jgi:hypothetical protein
VHATAYSRSEGIVHIDSLEILPRLVAHHPATGGLVDPFSKLLHKSTDFVAVGLDKAGSIFEVQGPH